MRTTALFLSVTVLALSGCAQWGGPGPDKDKTYAITILHTNDHHGRFWKNRDGEYGMAARKTVVDQIRQEVKAAGGYSLLLDGGDVNTGVPESDLQDAVPDFRGMNLMGYDAMAVGNHEFDKPPVVLQPHVFAVQGVQLGWRARGRDGFDHRRHAEDGAPG